VAPIRPTDDLFDLGLTSLSAATVHARIRRETGALLTNGAIFRAPTIASLSLLVADALDRERLTSIVAIQPGGTRRPFFCVHGGAGTVLHLRPLSRALGPDQPFFGLQAAGLCGHGYPDRDIPAMARRYVAEMRMIQPHGPYLLGGYCFGTIVAWEMIHQLRTTGEDVALLAVFNGPSSEELRRRQRAERARRMPPSRAGRVRRRAALASMDSRRVLREVRREGEVRWARWRRRPLGEAFLRKFYKHRCQVIEQRYRSRPWPGRVVVFRGAGLYEDDALGWRGHGATVVVHQIPGDHRTQRTLMAEPHASVVAPILAAELARADRLDGAPLRPAAGRTAPS
jgi:thioesterase domain-containing protein